MTPLTEWGAGFVTGSLFGLVVGALLLLCAVALVAAGERPE